MNIQGIDYVSINNDPIIFHGGGKITNSSNVDRNNTYNTSKIENKGSAAPVINAIDIDWNGAQLGEKTINTTSDLLTLIKDSLLTKEQLTNINELINLLNVLKNYFNKYQDPSNEEIIDNGDGPYYWYVGNTQPTDSTNPKTTKGWTSLTSKPNQIVVFAEDPQWNDVQWYLAAPAEWNFDTTFNGVHVGGWVYSTIEINGMEYSIWKGGVLTDSVNVTLTNV